MTTIVTFIESYGYLATFVGAIFEGKSVVLLGGLSSHETYLSFPLVMLCAMAGAIVGDWGFFFLGRYKKEKLLARFPYFKRCMQTPTALIERKPKFISFTMRFMYGFRHIVPFSIGASRVPTLQFLTWNGLGAILWAAVFTSAGYVAGNILEEVLGGIRRHEFQIIVFTIFIAGVFWAVARGVRMLLRQDEKQI